MVTRVNGTYLLATSQSLMLTLTVNGSLNVLNLNLQIIILHVHFSWEECHRDLQVDLWLNPAHLCPMLNSVYMIGSHNRIVNSMLP